MKNPLVSVLLPVFNCELYIKECIISILNQTFTDFELLIFNDGSQDHSLEIINEFKDNRIIVFNSTINVGYVKLLNQGISLSKGKYIIRMDADDVCCLNRFEELVSFMEKKLDIGVCGSYVRVFGNINAYVWKFATNDNAIKALLPFRIPFVHPSVIIRKSVLIDNSIFYKNEFLPAEDYEIWCNLSSVTKFANLPIILLNYRQHNAQISKEKKNIQQNHADKVRELYFLNLFTTSEDFLFYQNIVNERLDCSLDFFKKTIELFTSLANENYNIKLFDKYALNNELSFQLFKVATHLSSNGIYTFKLFNKSNFAKSTYITNKLYIKFVLKNIKLLGKNS